MGIQFFVTERNIALPDTLGPGPVVLLIRDGWDDYHFKTTFNLLAREKGTQFLDLGLVKILHGGQTEGETPIPLSFKQLENTYVSLGQDIKYYETLKYQFSAEFRTSFLSAMRDMTASPWIRREFEKVPGVRKSLLRFGQAVHALEAGRNLLTDSAAGLGKMSFTYEWSRGPNRTPIDFSFDDTDELPGRCHVLIGYNGAGKTTFLADLALTASSGEEDTTESRGTIEGEDTTFGAVITISYSAFDTFTLPKERQSAPTDIESADSSVVERFGYVYCGLRSFDPRSRHTDTEFKLKSTIEIQEEWVNAVNKLKSEGGTVLSTLQSAFDILSLEPSFGLIGIDLQALLTPDVSVATNQIVKQLSTGHQIVLNIVTQLAAHLRSRSLVLIDEPETHLHPPLIAALLRSIRALLHEHDSFAVITTHSPVVVQEVDSGYVRILERFGHEVNIRKASIETFGNNIGTITRHVFSLDSKATDYQGVLEKMANSYTMEDINGKFPNGLSPQASAIVLNHKAAIDNDHSG